MAGEEKDDEEEREDVPLEGESGGQFEKRDEESSGRNGPDLEMLERLVATGHSDAEVCYLMEVHRSTLFRWKKRPDVRTIFQAGRKGLVGQIEKSLYRRALGDEVVEREYRMREVKRKSGKVVQKLVLVKETRKTLAPDTLALIFALKNLAPDAWKDKHEYTGERVIEIALTDVKTRADIDRIKAILQARMDQLRAQGKGAPQSEPKGFAEGFPRSTRDSDEPKSDA